MHQPLMVIKRDGTTEPYNPDNIYRVSRAAGLNEKDAKHVAAQITKTLQTHRKKQIHSTVLRTMMVGQLKKISAYAAGLYEWYEGTKK